jgi:hypothetical protein
LFLRAIQPVLPQGLSSVSENFAGIKLNDKNQIVGYSYKHNVYCLFDKEHLIDLSEELHNFEFIRIGGNLMDINNNGVIIFQGEIWGEYHAIKLSPVSK